MKPKNSPMADFSGYIILCLTWLAAIVVYRFIFGKTGIKQLHLPPSPIISLPIIGHLHLLDKIPHQDFHKLSNQYGPLIYLKLGSIPCVVASSPEVAKEFLKTHESSFSKRPQKIIVDYLTYGSKDFTFAPYGPYWKFMKRLCMSELLGSQTLDQLLPPIRCEEINNFVILMLKKAEMSEAVDVGRELIRLVYDIISRMTVGQKSCEHQNEGSEVIKLVKEAAELVGRFNLSDYVSFCRNLDLQGFGKRVKSVRKSFDTIMDKIIKEHEDHARDIKKEDNAIKDLLDILLDISEDERSEIRLTRENIKSFILVSQFSSLIF